MNIERILYPTDFSQGAAYALPYAVDMTKHYSAHLYILHVVYDIKQVTGVHVPHISSDEMYKELNEWAVNQIGTCCIEEIRGLPSVEKKVTQGIPYEGILKFAREEKIDMIVMGTYGRVGLQRLVFGNTAERVVRRAPCPVLTVRIPEHRTE